MAETPGYFRWPTIFGDRIVFVSEDDLWEVSIDGGDARRLTSGLGAVSHPAFSPDGSLLAFVGSEGGTREVFVMDSAGGPAQQLTYLASLTSVTGWSEDGRSIRFRSTHQQFSHRLSTIFEVDIDGGEPRNLHLGKAHWLSEQPNGAGRVLGRNADDLARWKRYRGGTAGKLWIDAGQGWKPLLPQLTSGLVRPMWLNGPEGTRAKTNDRIYFLNDEDGTANIWSCTTDGEDLQRHTDHTGFYARFATTDGTTIVYTVAGKLWVFNPQTNESKPLTMRVPSGLTQLNRKFVDAADYLGDWGLHPRGFEVALTSRGKLFNFANWEGGVRQLGEAQGVRYRLPIMFDDGAKLLVVSDEGGEESLQLFEPKSLQGEENKVVTTEDIGRAVEMKLSPDEKTLAIANHRHQLLLVNLESGAVTEVDRSSSMWIAGFNWSADSRWVAYAVHDTQKTSLIRVYDTTTGTVHDVTEPGFRDSDPCFDPEGRYLYFVSSRWFEPVPDSLFFELSFPQSARPCVVTLKADELSLFLEKPRPLDGDDGDDDDEDSEDGETGEESTEEPKDEKAAKDEKENEPPTPVEIDFDGIAHRVEAFKAPTGQYGDISATKSEVYWVSYGAGSDGGTLHAFSLSKRKSNVFATGVSGYQLSGDGKTLGYETADGVRVVSAGYDGPSSDEATSADRKSGWLDLDRVPVAVDPRAEWRQMLREAWRLMRDHYWDANMVGIDWEEVWTRYSALLGAVSSRSEFSDLVWTMQGEMGTSHAYEYGGDYREPPRYTPGLLGADFSWDPEVKAYRIDALVRGIAWEPQQSSPLCTPGVNAKVGEHLVGINGRRVSEHTSINEALVLLAGQEVEVSLRNADGEVREHTVRPLAQEYSARYRDWVAQNRARVHAASDGKLGYVHIPDMSPEGYAEFHRGFLAELRRDGLVVDVRNNGGGNVSQLILEKLARKRIGYDISRWMVPQPYPEESVPGPLVAVTDENAGSDGDIFSHCFKLMQLGTLVGKRTWGGVVGIWPRHELVDGSITTQPEFAFWFTDVGFSIENYGTEPDVEVEQPPEAEARGEDPQLDRAIAIALEQLGAVDTTLPNFGSSPNILRPPSRVS